MEAVYVELAEMYRMWPSLKSVQGMILALSETLPNVFGGMLFNLTQAISLKL